MAESDRGTDHWIPIGPDSRVRFVRWRVLSSHYAMHELSDQQLLRRYADHGADDAFAELVRRHCNLVWATARRVGGDDEIARDVAQTVFTDLWRKAEKLPEGVVLAGWLYRAACHATANQIRREVRRAQREQRAMHEQGLLSVDPAERRSAEELQPLLDAALASLAEADRNAVLLRYFAGRSLAQIGATLGTNEDAARKRVGRALEKLRDHFRQRGVDLAGGTVAAAMTLAGAQAAPVGLATNIAGMTLAGASTATFASSLLLFMKYKLTFGILGGAVITTALVWQQSTITQLANENAALSQRLEAIHADRPLAGSTNSPASRELERQIDEHAELLRLRGEVAQLRQQKAQTGAVRSNNTSSKPEGRTQHSTMGAATPSAGLQRLILASKSGEAENVAKFVTWLKGEDVPEEVANQIRGPMVRNLMSSMVGSEDIRILNQLTENDTMVRTRVQFMDKDGKATLRELRFVLENDEWKPAFTIERSPSGSFGATLVLPTTPELGPTQP